MKKQQNRGITLVALIVTIIILIILAGISVNFVLGENGLFGRALQAREDYIQAEKEEQETFNALLAEIDKIGQGEQLEEITKDTPAGDKVKKPEGWSNTTEAISDGAGHAIPLPNGYYYLGGDYANGLVISDKANDNINATGTESGNQFVWIPIEGATKEEKEAYFTRTDFTNGSPTGSPPSEYTEPYKEGYEEEQTEYQNMYDSVIQYGGFYIGRYEAGINNSDETSPRTSGGSVAEDVVSKAGVWPYNYVPWGKAMNDTGEIEGQSGAVYLAKNKYLKEGSEQAKSVVSTLVYGIQWDTMCKYIETAKANLTRPNSQEAVSKTKSYPEEDGAKNIYDLAGNCGEWTMEAKDTSYRVYRGGDYDNERSVSGRNGTIPNYGSNDEGSSFRLALYIK